MRRENLSNPAESAAPVMPSVTCKKSTACAPENNCFPGSTLRTQVYTNMCRSYDTQHLLRDKLNSRQLFKKSWKSIKYTELEM